MLSPSELSEMNSFLNRLQGKVVHVELSSRINTGFSFSFATKLERVGDNFNFNSEKGEVSIHIEPGQAESFSASHDSISLVYGEELVTIRYSRKR